MKTIEEIFEADRVALLPYTNLPKNGIHIDLHNKLIKVTPADYTKETFISSSVTHDEIYTAIEQAKTEAYQRYLTKPNLPLGKDTHEIYFEFQNKSSKNLNSVIAIVMHITPNNSLPAFSSLVEKSKQTRFSLGRVPYHNANVFHAMTRFCNAGVTARITNVFARKRDNKTRIKVGIAFNPFIFGIETQHVIDLD